MRLLLLGRKKGTRVILIVKRFIQARRAGRREGVTVVVAHISFFVLALLDLLVAVILRGRTNLRREDVLLLLFRDRAGDVAEAWRALV